MSDIMLPFMLLGFILGIVLFLRFTSTDMSAGNILNFDGTPKCPPHRWIYVNDSMVCTTCNKRPEL